MPRAQGAALRLHRCAQLQGVVPVGTIISWLFAKPSDGGQNGFSLTGGILNYTAEVFYPDSGDRVSLGFQFRGSDVFDHLRAEVRLYSHWWSSCITALSLVESIIVMKYFHCLHPVLLLHAVQQ